MIGAIVTILLLRMQVNDEEGSVWKPVAVNCGALLGKVSVSSRGTFPPEASMHLWFGSGKKRFKIEHPAQLKGYVKIDSAADALGYLRLFSTPFSVFFVNQSLGLEIVFRGDLSLDWACGDSALLKRLMDAREGTFGIMDKRSSQSMAKCTPTAKGFLISRTLILPVKRHLSVYSPYYVKELVGRNGSYKRISIIPVKSGYLAETYWTVRPGY